MFQKQHWTEFYWKHLCCVYRKLYYLCEPDELKKYKGYDSERGKDAVLRSIICDVDLTYGYSLTSLFIKGDTYLATGGTRASGLHGQIKIFKVENFEAKLLTQNFKFLKTLIGSKFNAGFGTTILGADLNGDGVDELLVGEPYRTVNDAIVMVGLLCKKKFARKI